MYESKASATISRHDPKENDVPIEILFCGVCHAYERLLKSDVKYRFSIDMASLQS